MTSVKTKKFTEKMSIIFDLTENGDCTFKTTKREIDYKEQEGCTMAYNVADNYLSGGKFPTAEELKYINEICNDLYRVLGKRTTSARVKKHIKTHNRGFVRHYNKLASFLKKPRKRRTRR